MLLYQILAFTMHRKNIKNPKTKKTKTKKLKYQLLPGMESLNYPKDHILYQIFKIILSIS